MPRQLYMPDNRTFLIAPANTNARKLNGLYNLLVDNMSPASWIRIKKTL